MPPLTSRCPARLMYGSNELIIVFTWTLSMQKSPAAASVLADFYLEGAPEGDFRAIRATAA